MDDPLIGLTIYDTTKVQGAISSKSSLHGSRKESSSNGTQVCTAGKSQGNENIDDAGEDCFPCLPSLPDNQERKDVETSDSSLGTGSVATSQVVEEGMPANQTSQPKNFWLMRLFQSNLFDMSIAIGYLFNSKDQSVQAYLGSRLFVSLTASWQYTTRVTDVAVSSGC